MLTKIYFFLLIIFFSGCSTNKVDEVNLDKFVSINEKTNLFNFVIEKEKVNSRLSEVIELKNIFNPESYQYHNSLVTFPFEKIWEIDTNQNIDDENPLLPKPIFISSNIYLLNNSGVLYKINGGTGQTIWKKNIFQNLEDTVIGTPAVSGQLTRNGIVTLYMHNGFDELVAVNGDNGEKNWTKKHDLPFRGGITVKNDVLFLNDFEGNLLAISNDGKTIWTSFLGSDHNSIYTSARPVFAKNKIVVPGSSGSFFVLDFDDGEVLWTKNISSNKYLPKLYHAGDIIANPIYHNGNIYVVSQSGITAKFDLNTGEELWSAQVGGLETPALSGETIFVNGNMGLFVALDIETGNLRWKKQFPKYVNEDSFFLDKEIAIYKGPTIVNSKILLSKPDGNIAVFDANSGNEVSFINVEKLAVSPMPVEKKLFLLTVNGKLIAYK